MLFCRQGHRAGPTRRLRGPEGVATRQRRLQHPETPPVYVLPVATRGDFKNGTYYLQILIRT